MWRYHPHVADVHQTGMIAAIERVAAKASRHPCPASERRGLRVDLHGLEHHVLLRLLGNVVYFMPPCRVTLAEIDLLVDTAIAGYRARDQRLKPDHFGALSCAPFGFMSICH